MSKFFRYLLWAFEGGANRIENLDAKELRAIMEEAEEEHDAMFSKIDEMDTRLRNLEDKKFTPEQAAARKKENKEKKKAKQVGTLERWAELRKTMNAKDAKIKALKEAMQKKVSAAAVSMTKLKEKVEGTNQAFGRLNRKLKAAEEKIAELKKEKTNGTD